MRIQFLSSTEEHVVNGDKNYHKLTVTYKNLDNPKQAIEVKNMTDFGTPKEVYNRLKDAQKNELFQIESKKVNNFWNWTEISRDDGAAPPPVESNRTTGSPAVSTPSRTSTYETPEERAAKQILIVRQSSLSNAVLFCKDQGKKPTVEEVIEIAAKFENYVFGRGMAGVTDDIPN